MLNFIAADAWTSDALWAWFSAQRAINDAIAALEEAGAALLPLVDESQWQAQGVQALHQLIVEMKNGAAAETGQLVSRLWEIEAVGQ